jgi:hypothetical protein
MTSTSYTHPHAKITHPDQIAHKIQQELQLQQQQSSRHRRQYHRSKVIISLAKDKFERTDGKEGLTYLDLTEGRYKLVPTPTEEQAQELLYNLRKDDKLYTNNTMTIPRQYFATKDQADLADINSKKNTHSYPSGVSLMNKSKTTRTSSPIDHCLRELKAHNLLEVLLAMPSAPTFWHNHRYDFSLLPDGPDPPSTPYYDRLAWIRPDPQNNQGKTLPHTCIDSYEIKVDVFPNATVTVTVPSTDNPLPFPNTEELANEFLVFLGEIRGYIQRCLSDKRGVIVPSVLSWRLVHADINKDVPCSSELFITFPKLEISRLDGVFRLYARMLQGHCHVRLEKGNHVFNQTMEEAIGSLIKEL